MRSWEQRTGGTGSTLSEIVGDDLGLLRSLPFRSFSDRMRKSGIVAVAGRRTMVNARSLTREYKLRNQCGMIVSSSAEYASSPSSSSQ